MLFIHFAKCVYEKNTVTYLYMTLQNLASTQYILVNQDWMPRYTAVIITIEIMLIK